MEINVETHCAKHGNDIPFFIIAEQLHLFSLGIMLPYISF